MTDGPGNQQHLTSRSDQQTITFSTIELALRDFLLDRKSSGRSPATLATYSYTLRPFVDWLITQDVGAPEQINAPIVRSYMSQLGLKYANRTTVHGYARDMRVFLRWLYNTEWMPLDVMAKIRIPAAPEKILPSFTRDELHKVMDAAETSRDKAMLRVLFDSGLRARELCALTVGDLNVTTGQIIVASGKGGKQRVSFLGTKTLKALVTYLRTRGTLTKRSPMFVSERTGEQITYAAVRFLMERIARDSGVEICHAHTFRRSFAIWSLRDGMNPLSVQLLLGHSDPRITRRYLDIIDADLEKQHREHGPVDRVLSGK
jgi:site-specific recombinase XerD